MTMAGSPFRIRNYGTEEPVAKRHPNNSLNQALFGFFDPFADEFWRPLLICRLRLRQA